MTATLSTILRPCCAVALAFALITFSRAGPEKEPDHVEQIGVLIEHIQLDAKTASKLVRKYSADFDATEFRDEVQELVDEEKASMIESSYLLTQNGLRARVSSIHDFIYPIDYEETSRGGTYMIRTFDIGWVGSTIEVEPQISDGLVYLNLSPHITELVELTKFGKGEGETNRPLFFHLNLGTTVTILDGGYALAAMQVPRSKKNAPGVISPDPSSRILVFVKATIYRIPKK